MLSRLLLVLDVLLVAAAGTLGVHLYQVWTAAPSTASAAAPPPAAPGPAAPAAPPTPAPPGSLATFGVVAERNLFSPTRNEAGPEPSKPTTPTIAAPPAPKPRLYGIVIGRDGGSRAYLEDPKTRKVFAYTIGDTVADSRVEQISADRVVLRRGGDVFEVLLRDPAKPRPAPPMAVPGAPGVPTVPAMPTTPGIVTPGFPGVPAPGSAEFPQAGVPFQPYDPTMQPGVPMIPGQPPAVPTPSTRPVIPGRPPTRVPGAIPSPPGVPSRPLSPGTPGS